MVGAKYWFVCFFCHLIVDLYITVKLLILLIIQGYLKANCGKFVEMKGVGTIFSGGWRSMVGVVRFLMITSDPGHYDLQDLHHFLISHFIFFSSSQLYKHWNIYNWTRMPIKVMIIKMVKYVIFQMFMRHSDIYGDFSAEKLINCQF